jgi:hypothetical protein
MWYGKNDNKWDDDSGCCCKLIKLTDKQLKEKLEAQQLKAELEQHFFEILNKDERE